MKAKAKFWTNNKEVEQADKLGVAAPVDLFEWDDLHFSLPDVSLFYKSTEGDIVIYIYGNAWTLQYGALLWSILENAISPVSVMKSLE